MSDIDRELENNAAALGEARAELARLMNLDPESELRTVSDLPLDSVPTELERLRQLALASRPDLQGRLAAIDARPGGHRAGPEAILSEHQCRRGLSGHGEDQCARHP